MIRLGVDLGTRRTGLSLHAEEEVPARAMEAIEMAKVRSVVEAIAAVCAREAVEEIVVGLALHMNGTESASSRSARKMADALGRRTGLAVVLWDERLTTAQAQRSRVARGEKGRAGIDSEAAAILLQSYIDAKRGGSGYEPDDDGP